MVIEHTRGHLLTTKSQLITDRNTNFYRKVAI
ncbi:hypothetical protein COLO4_37054 [Corchorus olitorius]|uniref:Uncharacterized protein n=1 Tax=Corchorus olitorius TaxID=93759 RepID=A0A1R3G3K6_9ROSI|nr:hypothetical protein COLO4_37054 [Corchorus olitorius]